MVQAGEKTSSARIAAAARLLVEGDMVDAAAGRFSRTVFMVNRVGDPVLERCAFDAALETGIGVVALRSGRDAGSTPRRANIALVHEGARLEVRDCVLWSGDEDGPVVLVPWDAREDCHFAIGPDGLERRAGRPETMLGQGMSRARARLERTARKLRQDQLLPCLVVLTENQAA